MADSTTIDPNATGLLTPAQEEARLRAEAAATAPTFTPDTAAYKDTATKEISPFYSDILSNIDTATTQGVAKLNTTYDDLLSNIRESYNRRGTFFSGESIGAEGKANVARTDAIGNLVGTAAEKRAQVGLEQGSKIATRAGQLQEQAYADFANTQKAEVEKKVYSSLASYLPKYAEAIRQQAKDANSPWLDLPLDGDTAGTVTAPATTTTTVTPKSPYGRYLTPAEAKSGKYKGKVVVIKGSGIRFKTPADEPK